MRTSAITIALAASIAHAGAAPATPFTETFDLGGENWAQGSGAPVDWDAGVVSTTVDVNSAGIFGLTLFRIQDNLDSSNDAFVGNYFAGGITSVRFDVLQDSGQDLSFGLRMTTATNSDAFALLTPTVVSSGVWTTLTFELDESSPFFFAEGPPGSGAAIFDAVMSGVGNMQISVNRPDGLAMPLTATFSVDNFATVPGPAGIAMLGMGGLVAARRRRV
jgi:hypothetical protein